jgi:hypothetical protein
MGKNKKRSRFMDTEVDDEEPWTQKVKGQKEELYAHRRTSGRMTRAYGPVKTGSRHMEPTTVDYGDLTLSLENDMTIQEDEGNNDHEVPTHDDDSAFATSQSPESLPGGLKVPATRAKRYADSVCFDSFLIFAHNLNLDRTNLFVLGWRIIGTCTSMHSSVVKEEGGLGSKTIAAVNAAAMLGHCLGVEIALDLEVSVVIAFCGATSFNRFICLR